MKLIDVLCIFVLYGLCIWTTASCLENRTTMVYNGFPLPIDCGTIELDVEIKDNETVLCVITEDFDVLYNESILWEKRNNTLRKDAGSDLNGKIIKVALIGVNFNVTKSYNITVSEPPGFNCMDEDKVDDRNNLSRSRWEDYGIKCFFDNLPQALDNTVIYDNYRDTDLQYVMYHDCHPNSTVEIIYDRVRGLTYFGPRRRITTELAGAYSYVAVYKGKETPVCRSRLCVEEPFNENKPISIKSVAETYEVVLGTDRIFQCKGIGSLNAEVVWKKQKKDGNWTEDCYTDGDYYYDDNANSECEYEYHKVETVCQRTPETNQNFHTFTSSYTLRNISYADAGNYSCEVDFENAISHFQIIVIPPPTFQLSQLLIPLVILLIIAIIVLICLWKRMEIKYIYYKNFKKFTESEKLVTSLVYADDAFNETNKGEECNPLLDVRDVLGNRQYHDPHDGQNWNNYGEPRAEHTANVLDNSNSVTVIVTPNLVQDETAELLQTYEGLRGNVENKIPLIFICEKETERIIKEKAESGQGNGNERYVMFRSFMKRHPVVYWSKNNRKSFKKSLYVNLPTVTSSRVIENENAENV